MIIWIDLRDIPGFLEEEREIVPSGSREASLGESEEGSVDLLERGAGLSGRLEDDLILQGAADSYPEGIERWMKVRRKLNISFSDCGN